MHEKDLNARQIGALVALVEQGRLDEAERQTGALLKIHPDVGVLWKILSVVLVRLGREALPALSQQYVTGAARQVTWSATVVHGT